MLRTDVVKPPLLALPEGEALVCFTIPGEHDVLKSDKQDTAKVVQRRGETPTSDANRCRETTLTCPPLGSWNAVFYNT